MSTGKVVLGVLVGAAAGAVLGILFAPDKGSATRKKIMDMADNYTGDLKEKISDTINTVKDKVETVTDDAKDLVEKGKSKMDNANQEVKNEVNKNYSHQS